MATEKTLGQVAREAWRDDSFGDGWEASAAAVASEVKRRQIAEMPEDVKRIIEDARDADYYSSHSTLKDVLKRAVGMLERLAAAKGETDHSTIISRLQAYRQEMLSEGVSGDEPQIAADAIVALGGTVGPEPGQREFERLNAIYQEIDGIPLTEPWSAQDKPTRSAWAKFEESSAR